MLLLSALLAAAVPPLREPDPPPRIRPASELRCIYDEAPPATREAAARHMWALDRDSAAIVALLSEAQDRCRFRYHWDGEELVMAFAHVQSAILLDYARQQLTALHVDTSRLDRIYLAVPVGERTQRDSRVASRRMLDDLQRNPAAYAGDSGIAGHIGIYVFALGAVERTERMWQRLMPFNWF